MMALVMCAHTRLRRRPLRTGVLAVALSIAGCSSEAVPGPASGPAGVVALYGPAVETELVPYPSDRYAVADAATATGLRVHLGPDSTGDPMVAQYASTIEQLDAMDGFSTTGGVALGFSGPVDVRGLAPVGDPPDPTSVRDASELATVGSPVLLVDVDPASPEHGRARGVVARYWEQPPNVDFPVPDYTLVVQPARPLLPRTRYLFVVTGALRAADGGPVRRSADTEALLSGSGGDGYGVEVRDALKVLESEVGLPRDEVVLATAFTTASVVDEISALAERARAAPAPALLEPFTVETPLQADGRVRFRAVFETPEYRAPKPDGKWTIADGLPTLRGKVGLEAFLAFSDGTKSGPRPVVIFAHGLNGTKDGCWGTAERLAELGAAVFAIDSPEHGSRSADPSDTLGPTFSFFGIDPDTQSFDIGRARDNFRQMASDQLELVRFIQSLSSLDLLPVGAPDGAPDLDVSRIVYIGHSFGSVQGPLVFALAPEIGQAVWNVGGDGLMTLLRDSATFSLLVNALRPPGIADGDVARFFAITQGIVDPGDPLNYARFGTELALPGVPSWRPRDVLLQMVVDDNIVPNSTSEALARAAGLSLVDPVRPISGLVAAPAPLHGNLAGGATGAIVPFDRMYGDQTASHGELIFSDEARAQYVEFFRSGLESGHATVPPPYP